MAAQIRHQVAANEASGAADYDERVFVENAVQSIHLSEAPHSFLPFDLATRSCYRSGRCCLCVTAPSHFWCTARGAERLAGKILERSFTNIGLSGYPGLSLNVNCNLLPLVGHGIAVIAILP
ncbi:hypothetical protein PHAMO_270231 [Magnetospirillum molischianum DSM 120]|uniref:Uncharacterized protein n=1 Tax=Magnetospirillum molischianum DSM 120 TaxID=1150626 RepID=H8FSQ2_MAGML|nr:hypothetical protein PHAMO_270231 [Magnetospirillum molischianum DSM 120]